METAVLVAARAVHIGSAMLLVAFPFFLLVVTRGVGTAETCYPPLVRMLTRWFWWTLLAEAVSGAAWFWMVVAQMSDESPWSVPDPADWRTVLEQTEFGHLWLERLVVGLVLGGGVFALSRGRKSVLTGIPGSLALGLGGLLLGTLAWAGHAAAGTRLRDFHLGVDVAHLLAGAIWPAGLVPMGLFLRQIARAGAARATEGEMAAALRFSRVSLAAVLVLVATGVINGWLMVGRWDALVTTAYGGMLVAKVLLVVVMIGLGAVNRVYLLPRAQAEEVSFWRLRGTVAAETLLMVVVLVIVGLMGMTAPPG